MAGGRGSTPPAPAKPVAEQGATIVDIDIDIAGPVSATLDVTPATSAELASNAVSGASLPGTARMP